MSFPRPLPPPDPVPDKRNDPWAGHLLNQIAGRIRSLTSAALGPLGIKPPMLRALEAIDADGPLTQAHLGTIIHMDRSTIVHVIDRLETLGYAQRLVRPHDRRSHDLVLSELGKTKLRRARELARGVEDAVLAPLRAEDRRKFVELLQAIHHPANCPEERS